MARRVSGFGTLRAIAASGGIGGWVIWKDLAFVWGVIIAASQVAEALKDQFPFAARYKAATALLKDLEALLIRVLDEWESAYHGKRTTDEIGKLTRELMEQQHALEWKHFPTGDLPHRSDLLRLAEAEAEAFTARRYHGSPSYDKD